MRVSDYWPALRVPFIGWLVALSLLAGALGMGLHCQWAAEEDWLQATKQLQQRQQQVTQQASD